MDSRTLEFADQVRDATKGRGVDVVISALQGESFIESFSLLAPFGRYIQIGKSNNSEEHALPMSTFSKNLTYATIDIDRMWRDRPEQFKRIGRELAAAFDSSLIRPLPVTIFPARETEQAFRHMAEAKHIGKIVVKFTGERIDALPLEKGYDIIRPGSTYLVSGGTRGFGLEVARWLASKGAKQLLLVSRSGAQDPDSRRAIAEIEKHGTQTLIMNIDISNSADVESTVQYIQENLPPLRGIFHAAAVYDDGLLVELDSIRFRTVMEPKVQGALNLHRYTKDLPLDYFVCFSSVSSTVGNIGQGNYVAANGFLDGFAHYRRSLGLPATTINWGLLADTGVAARNKRVTTFLHNRGVISMPVKEALYKLEEILRANRPQIGAFRADWKRWKESNPSCAKSPRFREVLKDQKEETRAQINVSEFCDRMSSLAVGERKPHLESAIATQIGRVLRLQTKEINTNRGLTTLGIDSLMVLELRLGLKSEFGLELSTADLLNGPSIAELADLLIERLFPAEAAKENNRVYADTRADGN